MQDMKEKNEILTDIVSFNGMECILSNGMKYKLHHFCYFSTPVYANFIIEGDYIKVVLARRVGGKPSTL